MLSTRARGPGALHPRRQPQQQQQQPGVLLRAPCSHAAMQLLTSRRIGGGGIGGRVRRTNAAAAAAAAPPPRCDASSPPVPGQNVTPSDRAHLRRALDLARLGLGHTAPNPAVGCVLVAPDGRTVVGEGYHPRAGLPHAEVYALRAAGRAAEGATAYVTLEPCGHHGRTPPCAEALRDARVARVVVGCADPNPLVAGGGGLAALRAAGVAVALADGEEERLCRDLNPEFMARMEAEAEGAAKRRAEGEKEGAARR